MMDLCVRTLIATGNGCCWRRGTFSWIWGRRPAGGDRQADRGSASRRCTGGSRRRAVPVRLLERGTASVAFALWLIGAVIGVLRAARRTPPAPAVIGPCAVTRPDVILGTHNAFLQKPSPRSLRARHRGAKRPPGLQPAPSSQARPDPGQPFDDSARRSSSATAPPAVRDGTLARWPALQPPSCLSEACPCPGRGMPLSQCDALAFRRESRRRYGDASCRPRTSRWLSD
jgi:hypothetical protein